MQQPGPSAQIDPQPPAKDWNDPEYRRWYNRNYMRRNYVRRHHRSSHFNRRITPLRGRSQVIFPGFFLGSTYRSVVKKYLGELAA